MAQRSTLVNLENKTSTTLELKNVDLKSGIWFNNSYPPRFIKGIGHWHSESDGFATGTEGSVTYRLESSEVYIYWSNPFWGDNSYKAKAPDGYEISKATDGDDGKGDNAAITFILKSRGG
jgi:hypothetical protein